MTGMGKGSIAKFKLSRGAQLLLKINKANLKDLKMKSICREGSILQQFYINKITDQVSGYRFYNPKILYNLKAYVYAKMIFDTDEEGTGVNDFFNQPVHWSSIWHKFIILNKPDRSFKPNHRKYLKSKYDGFCKPMLSFVESIYDRGVEDYLFDVKYINRRNNGYYINTFLSKEIVSLCQSYRKRRLDFYHSGKGYVYLKARRREKYALTKSWKDLFYDLNKMGKILDSYYIDEFEVTEKSKLKRKYVLSLDIKSLNFNFLKYYYLLNMYVDE